MLDFEQALKIVKERTPGPGPVVSVPLSAARGHVLARDITADIDMPPFDKSMMDGFALRESDILSPPVTLRVVGDIPAGTLSAFHIQEGEAAAIMTGAPMPKGADTVVKVEDTSGFGTPTVVVERGARHGANVSYLGEIIQRGDTVLTRGKKIGMAEVALLAAVGCDPVPVFDAPSVAILTTGDELVPPAETPGPGRIRNTNAAALTAFATEMGITPIDLGSVGDSKTAIQGRVAEGLTADLLLISGGVSAGVYDFVIEALRSFGVTIHFDKIAVKPGKPTVFGTKDNHVVLGLPGNPVSAAVIARLFAGTIIAKRRGFSRYGPRTVTATLTTDIDKKPSRLWFVPGILSFENGFSVAAVRAKGSADLLSTVRTNCLIIAPKGTRRLPADSPVTVVIWGRIL